MLFFLRIKFSKTTLKVLDKNPQIFKIPSVILELLKVKVMTRQEVT